MMPLAKLWSWTGHAFILFAIGWAIFVRGGLSDKALPEGVAISQGYWGLVVALIAANALILALALYVRAGKRAGITSLVPPNTNFEELEDRNLVISWGTVFVFLFAVALATVLFSVRYADSVLYKWRTHTKVADGFLYSRLQAHEQGCHSNPCFAVAPQFDGTTEIKSGVNEYLLYVTDGVLVVLVVALICLLIFALISLISYRPPDRAPME
jgi:hypothetical protein